MLDVVDQGGQHFFVGSGKTPFHLLRVEPGVLPGDGHNGDVDVGKDIGGRAHDHHRAHDEDQQSQDDEGVRPIERQLNDPHVARAPFSGSQV